MTTADHIQRLGKLEILFSEQEYTIETLNTVITRQDRDIDQLQQQVELLNLQLKELKKMVPQGDAPQDEKPPHY